jgi:hypothetical protein
MVGDYISTSFASNGKAYPVFAVAKKNKGSNFNEAMYTFKGGLLASGGTNVSTAPVVFTGNAQVPLRHTAN